MLQTERSRSAHRDSPGFTLIELLTVIAIMCMVAALAVPGFVAMMESQKWTTAIDNLQWMIWQARSLASNCRKDVSVEFDIDAEEGTWMWLESEEQLIERIPDLEELQLATSGGVGYSSQASASISWLCTLWTRAGGTYERENRGGGTYDTYYVNFQINQENARAGQFGDNARQTEPVYLAEGLTIDPSEEASPGFINWDSAQSVVWKGDDEYKDIRIGPSGSLVQSTEPEICIMQIDRGERLMVRVVLCTGRVLRVR